MALSLRCGLAVCVTLSVMLPTSAVFAKDTCNASAKQAPKSYGTAMKRVQRLPEFIEHLAHVTKNFPDVRIAFNTYSGTQQQIGGKCFWEVAIVENHPTHWHRWESFFVPLDGGELMVHDVTGGDPMNLADWRERNARWHAERKVEEVGKQK
jgi:hypothetical protein